MIYIRINICTEEPIWFQPPLPRPRFERAFPRPYTRFGRAPALPEQELLLFPIVEVSQVRAIRPPATPQELLQMQQNNQIQEVRFERTELRLYLKLGPAGNYDCWQGKFDIWSFEVPEHLIRDSL